MSIVKVTTETEREEARTLINKVFPKFQPILRTDRELVPLKERDEQLFGPTKELWVLRDQDRIVATVLLHLPKGDVAYVSHLAKYEDQPSGKGRTLLQHVEAHAKENHKKKKMQASTVYCPEICTQKGLEDWYIDQRYCFSYDLIPTPQQQESWIPEARKTTKFKYFEKIL